MGNSLEEYANKLIKSCEISVLTEKWEDNDVLDLIYVLIVNRVLHEHFIEDLYDTIKSAKAIALDNQFYKEG